MGPKGVPDTEIDRPTERRSQHQLERPVFELALSKEPNVVDVSFPSPEDENRSSFWNIVSYSI
jgi:hypothetical protein